MLITKKKKKKLLLQQQQIILKSSLVHTDITVQEILEVRHSQFEILTDNLLLWF